MSDPGWTDITSTNAIASTLLTALGYEPDVKTLSVPIGYEAMKNKDVDVFLGNWMPAQQKFIDDLTAASAVEVVGTNLAGAKFTLAVPTYVAEKGVKDFKDLAAHSAEFDGEIYGIEPGAPANANLQKMIDAGDFGLGSWKVVESGEQAMLAGGESADNLVAHGLPNPDLHVADALLASHRRAREVLSSIPGLQSGWTIATQDSGRWTSRALPRCCTSTATRATTGTWSRRRATTSSACRPTRARSSGRRARGRWRRARRPR